MRYLYTRFLFCDTKGGDGAGDTGFTPAQTEALTKMFGDFAAKIAPPTKNDDNKGTELSEQAKADMAAEAQRKAQMDDTEAATRFEMAFPKQLETDKDFYPKETDFIINAATAQNFPDKIQRTQAIKGSIMDAFFTEAKNIEVLNDTQKAKVEKYKALTIEDKRKQANQYWEVFELAIDGLKTKARVAAATTANGAITGDMDKTKKAYNEKIALASKRIVRVFN